MIRAGWEVAEAADTRFHIHVAEGQYEGQRTLAEHGATPIRFLDRLGVLGPRMIGVHCVWLDDEELAPDGRARRRARLLPLVQHDPRRRHHPHHRDAGASASASGSAPTAAAPTIGSRVFEEMRMAALLQKVRHLDGTRAPRRGGLRDGHGGRRGAAGPPRRATSRPGVLADLVAVDLGHPSLHPPRNLLKNVVYAMSPPGGDRRLGARPPGGPRPAPGHARPGRPPGAGARAHRDWRPA